MAKIFRATRFSTVLIVVLCILPLVVVSEDVSSSIIRLPSEVAGEGQNVCTVAKPSTCPVKCFRTDPVCGVDGVTYWCGCAEAACAGAEVAKMGFCEVGNASHPLSAQALLLVHIVWLILLAFSVFFGLF